MRIADGQSQNDAARTPAAFSTNPFANAFAKTAGEADSPSGFLRSRAEPRLGHSLEPRPDACRDLGHVSVIIPTHNDAAHLHLTLQRVFEQGRLRGVWIVDRASTDETREIGAAFGQRRGLTVGVIEGTETPDGWQDEAWQLQQGLRQIDTPLVAIVRPGVELLPYALATLTRLALNHQLAWASLVAKPTPADRWKRLIAPIADRAAHSALLPGGPRRPVDLAIARTDTLTHLRGFSAPGASADPARIARGIATAGFRTWWGRSALVRDATPR